MPRFALALLALSLGPAAFAADFTPERSFGKQPAYKGKPGYLLLAFGDDPKAKVWLVHDGDDLYVDRHGDGDLTGDGKKVAAKPEWPGETVERGRVFDVGEVTAGGKTHKALRVVITPLSVYREGVLGKVAVIKQAFARDAGACGVRINAEVEWPGLKGSGVGGRVGVLAGFYDLGGVLQFADRPEAAPVVRLGGPLVLNFYGELPALRSGRTEDVYLAVGVPGVGPGTFAMIEYTDTIPTEAHAKLEMTFAARPGEAPVKELYELKRRC
jgi:hypothetical protein